MQSEFFSSLGIRRPSSLTLTKIFSSETIEQNLSKHSHNHHWGILFKKCVRGPDQPTKMAAMAKIEHRGKMQFLAYNSKTKAFRANLRGVKLFIRSRSICPEIFRWIGQPVVRLLSWIGNFKEILPFFVIFLNIIIDRDKLYTPITFSKIRSTNKFTWPK